uniref:Fibronectin type III domain containing 5a n=1 Tax=Salarias fasciatus TaxID=181472 RepID=A0A672FKM8_SALFA
MTKNKSVKSVQSPQYFDFSTQKLKNVCLRFTVFFLRPAPTEEGRAHAPVHPGSQHDHTEPLRFRTPKEAETQASKSKDEVTMEEVGQTTQLRAGELIIIVVVLIMWAGVIALFCRQYDIIKDNEPNNNKDKAKNSSECSTPEHPTGGLLRSKV